jgi:hypothetical protein
LQYKGCYSSPDAKNSIAACPRHRHQGIPLKLRISSSKNFAGIAALPVYNPSPGGSITIVWKQMSFGLMWGRRASGFGSSMPAVKKQARSRRLSGQTGMKTAGYLKKKMSDLGVTAEVLPPMIGITLRPHLGAETIMQGRNILLVSGKILAG